MFYAFNLKRGPWNQKIHDELYLNFTMLLLLETANRNFQIWNQILDVIFVRLENTMSKLSCPIIGSEDKVT